MNKKGFTLVEVLAVIAVLGLLIAIITPTVNKLIKDSEDTLEINQINEIIRATKNYAVKDSDILPEIGSSDVIKLNIKTLIEKGIIDNETIINPKTKEELTGCVLISYNNNYNQYEYNFNEQCE